MKLPRGFCLLGGLLVLANSSFLPDGLSQEKVGLSHSALESSNALW